MARLAGFFFLIFAVLHVLRVLLADVPVVGAVLGVPLLGFWIVALGVSWVAARVTRDTVDRRRQKNLARTLGAVDTPRNRGKLGSLLLGQGRARAALPHLEAAAAADDGTLEWNHRLGEARLATGDPEGARDVLEVVVERDPEYAYGGARLRLAEACTRCGSFERALDVLDAHDRDHGPGPESAYRRGRAHRAAGDAEAARKAYGEAITLAEDRVAYQRRAASAWAWRARWARWTGA